MAGKRIIISRTDSIGDVMLTLPLCGFLKEVLPDCSLFFLGRTYTIPVLECCEHLDGVIDYSEIEKLPIPEQVEEFKKLKADIIIHVYPQKHIAKISSLAAIPKRIGTSGRSFHWNTCSNIVFFSRKNSTLHEAQLNFKLLKPLGFDKTYPVNELYKFSGFKNVHQVPEFINQTTANKKFVLHPKSKGSAVEWGMENFNKLIDLLSREDCDVFISGTAEEGLLLKKELKTGDHVADLTGKLDLRSFIALIDQCDGLVAASTGPLHIAAALGKKAIGLYSKRKPIHPGRWAPIGPGAKAITYDNEGIKSNSSADEDIKRIKPQIVSDLLLS